MLRNCFTRLLFGGRVIFCCQAPWCLMLSMESMIKIQAAGAGEDGRPLRPAFQKNFALFVVPFMFLRPGPCCRGRGPGDGKQGA